MKTKFFCAAAILSLAVASLFGGAFSSWALDTGGIAENEAQIEIPTWEFFEGPDFALIDNISTCSYLTASRETSIVSPNASIEAVRLTNTAGTQTKAHSFVVLADRAYTVEEIRFKKIEFDYYHAQKRQQAGKGFPKVQLVDGSTNRGAQQGGGETINDKSPFIKTDIGEGWWHLEYFLTAMVPTMADHQDTPISLSTRVTGIKITDDTVYDHDSITAFLVIDNLRFSSAPASRLGLFNRTTSYAAGTYYWAKIAWVGELKSVNILVSDDSIAEYAPSSKSPFYIKGLQAGTFTFTAIVEIGDGSQVLTISNTVTVT